MAIGEFSERSGLTPKRLRSYATAGLLVPAAVDASSGYRYYAPAQLHDARVIDALRRAEVPVAEIGDLLRDPSPGRLDAWARRIEVDTTERRAAIRDARALLDIDAGGPPMRAASPAEERRTMNLVTAARSDVGRVRTSNQDRALCLDRVVMVADGLGASPGGETASALAAAVVEAVFSRGSVEELEAAVRAANTAVFERAGADEQLDGMGTTLCAAGLTAEGDLAVVHVGDSRVYRVHDGAVERLTTDHSVVAEMIRRGELTEEESLAHEQRAVLTRAIGVGPTVEVDSAVHRVAAGDRLLLCSDGLFTEVPEERMRSLVDEADDLDAAAQALVDEALANGARDNVTVVLAEITG